MLDWPPRVWGWRTSGGATSAAHLLTWLGAALVVVSGAVHLDLFLTTYGHIQTIAALFLAQAITAFLLAVALVVLMRPIVALAGALFLLSTLGGYVLALLVSLFGFQEVRTSTGIAAAVIEILGAGVLTASAALSILGLLGRLLRLATVVAVVVPVAAVAPALAVASSTTQPAHEVAAVDAARVGRYGMVLTNHRGLSLYLFTSKSGNPVPCKGGCLSIWPPLLVSGSVHRVQAGPGVAGHLGLVTRSGTTKQVTYNGYPLYTYAGDSRPGQATGQGIVSFGGTWYLLRASARAPASTAVR